MKHQEMTICLWFDNQAEQAAKFYTSIFADSAIGKISRFGKEGFEFRAQPEGTAMAVEFRLNKMKFTTIKGGDKSKFNESISIILHCDTQEEIDHYWTNLSKEGIERSCGWLKDQFGVSWQINPTILADYLSDNDKIRKSRVEWAAFQMKKFDIKKLIQAFERT
ncbi:MAG: VOC family protein [Lentimicrobium sp.]|nr:VOC family protein [Lentimicrobium sp.]